MTETPPPSSPYSISTTEAQAKLSRGDYTVVFKSGAIYKIKDVIRQRHTAPSLPDRILFTREFMGEAVNLKPDGSAGFIVEEISAIFREKDKKPPA